MESRFQTSFIPKKPIDPVSSEISSDRSPLGFFFGLSIFIAILALLAAGGVFAYSKIVDKQISGLQASLQASQKEFDGPLVAQLQRLDSRITSAKSLLNNHTGFSTFFTLLSNDTLKTIQYTDFQYSNLGTGKVSISLKGVAKDYASVARQSEIFSDADYTNNSIKSPIFSDLNLNQAGNVVFGLSALLDPTLISYKKNLEAAGAANQSAALPATAANQPTPPAQATQPDQTQQQSNVVSNP